MAMVFFIGLIFSPVQFLVYTDDEKELFLRNFTVMKSVKTVCLVDMIVRFFAGYWDQENFVVSIKN